MKKIRTLITEFKLSSYEERLVKTSFVTLCISFIIAIGKIIVGIFSNYMMCVIGAFNIMLIISKLGCISGIKKKKDYTKQNVLISCFLFLGGITYCVYMIVLLVLDKPANSYPDIISIMIALIAFVEMGLSIYGLLKTKSKGHYYRNIKIIGFTSALTALMTAQIALLAFTETANVTIYNSSSGIAIGVITMILSIYIYFAPQFSTFDREYNVFKLDNEENNTIIDVKDSEFRILLINNKVYGNYVYEGKVNGLKIEGHIKKENKFRKNMHVTVKILFIVLSEILVFVWAIGFFVYWLKTIDMPSKLLILMIKNGFTKIN